MKGLGPLRPGKTEIEMDDATGTAIMMRNGPTFREESTYFACLEIEGDVSPMFAHFNPPLGVLPGETIHEAHARQPWVMVGILPEPLVPAGVPVLMDAPEADESQLSPALLKQLAPLVWQHVCRYGFAPVPFNPATWRGSPPLTACP